MFSIRRISGFQINFFPSLSHFSTNLQSTAVEKPNQAGSKRSKRLYGFGVVATGALGVKEHVIPENASSRPPPFAIHSPLLLRYFLENHLDVKSIACGFGFSIFMVNNPKRKTILFGCGLNTDGQLGQQLKRLHGTIGSSGIQVDLIPEPQPIGIRTEDGCQPFMVSCGRTHALVACESSDEHPIFSIYSLGNNTFGQCAREIINEEIFTSEKAVITKVSLPTDLQSIKQVVCGQDHSLVLTNDGTVFSSGLGVDGQTGLGFTNCVDRLTRVKGAIENVTIDQLSSRGDTVLALSRCGRIFGWGNNEYGQLWSATESVQVLEPIELPFHDYLNFLIKKQASDDPSLSPDFKVGKLRVIASCGSMCAVLDEHGHVFVWGFGCLGLGPEISQATSPRLIPPALFAPAMPHTEYRICDVVPGLHHFIARSRNGLLWSWGAPRSGSSCLGLGKLFKSQSHSNSGNKTFRSLEVSNPASKIIRSAQTYPSQLSIPAEALEVFCGVDHTIVLSKSFG